MFVDLTKQLNLLPILSATVLTDLLFMVFLSIGVFHSKVLEQWYHKFTLSAVLADVLILVIGILLARLVYPLLFRQFHLVWFAMVAVVIQIVHDLFFAYIVSVVPRGQNRMVDTFQAYQQEMGLFAVVGDSCMMLSSVVLSSLFAKYGAQVQGPLLVVLVYVLQYVLYQF